MLKGKRGQTFTNWASSYSCSPELCFSPTTRDELIEILSDANRNDKKVKVVGNGRSPSDIACTDGYMVSMKHFDKIISIDREKKQCVVEAGIQLSSLIETLHDNDLAFSVLPSISEITLAGAVSTGTHGTGLRHGSLSTYILGLEMMCADGTILTLSRASDKDLFLAACLNLGALGILLSVKLQCESTYKLECIRYGMNIEDFYENFNVHFNSSEYFRAFIFPHTGKLIAFHVKRTDKPAKRNSSWIWDRFIGYYILEILLWLSTFFAFFVPWINKIYEKFVYSRSIELVARYDKVLTFDCLFQQHVMEWALPIANTGVFLHELNSWLENNFYAHFPIEVRTSRSDDIPLSPAYHMDCCYINILMFRPFGKTVPFQTYWEACQNLALKYGGRPHWAKDLSVTRHDIERMYPMFGMFSDIRRRLDPKRMFINDYLDRFF